MQYGGDDVAVCMIKMDCQLNCTGIVGDRGLGCRLRMQRDYTGDRHEGYDSDRWRYRRSYSSSRITA